MVSKIAPLSRAPDVEKPRPSPKEQAQVAKSFQAALSSQLQIQEKVKLSAHVQKRLEQRKIHLAETDWQKINNAVSQARTKGVKDSLLLYHDLALVASIENNTIITALDGEGIQNQVFTNIDGAVIIK